MYLIFGIAIIIFCIIIIINQLYITKKLYKMEIDQFHIHNSNYDIIKKIDNIEKIIVRPKHQHVSNR
jgi:hypothetical protein